MYRTNKNSEWLATLSYNFTRPVSKTKGLANTLRVALLFAEDNTVRTRALILKELGEPRWEAKGQLACMFTALNTNRVIKYDKESKSYIKGSRHKEFLEYCFRLIQDLNLKDTYKEEFVVIAKEVSQSLHFILEDT